MSFIWVPGTETRSRTQLEDGGTIETADITGSLVADYAPPGIETAEILALNATVVTSISGIVAPIGGIGRRLLLLNRGAISIGLLRNNVGSLASSRILMADATFDLAAGAVVAIHYKPNDARWYLEAPSASAAPPVTDLCITRTVSANLSIAADTTCLQRRPLIAAGVSVTIGATGEWLIL